MALPEQVRKQIEAAEEKVKELYGEPQAEQADADQADDNSGDTSTEAKADNATETVRPSDANEHRKEEDPNSETYAQRWRTLQGQYNAEVPRLRNANKEMQSRVEQLEQLLSSIQQSSAATQAAPQSQAQRFVTDADVEEYGDSIDMMRKVTREELSSLTGKIGQLEQLVQSLSSSVSSTVLPQVQRVAQQQAATAEERFWSNLATAVPNWQQINNDPDFQSWLLEIDPLTNTSRQTHLELAQRDLDSNRVAAFFSAYTSGSGKFVPAANAQPNRSASELEKQVAPGRSRGNSGTPANQTAKSYTPDDIKKFFNDVRSGKFKGRESERDRIERDIFAAQREGRIVQTSQI